MKKASAKGYAKINLTLDIVGVEGGFHLLDSICAPLPLYDTVSVTPSDDFSSNLDGVIPREKNTAIIAARLMSEAFDIAPSEIFIKKNIPYGYGVGGSSADAVATVKALKRLYDICDEEKIKFVLSKCGSDALMQYAECFVRMQGFGEKVTKLDTHPHFEIVLCGIDIPVSSKDCYFQYDKMNIPCDNSTQKLADSIAKEKIDFSFFSNDLTMPAIALAKDIEKVKIELEKCSPLAVNMTGSGSAFYGVFKNKREAKQSEKHLKKLFSFAKHLSI